MESILQTAFAKQTLLACKGYVPSFIDNSATISFDNILSGSLKKNLPEVEGNKKGILNYTNLSVLYDAQRRVPFTSAYNVDGSSKSKSVIRASNFQADPRIDQGIQLSQKGFYDLRTDIIEFEIGHMAANNEMAWGPNAQLQSYQTFHFPNSAPQAAKLNTGIWKTLETYIINEAASIAGNKKLCVFTGPLLRSNDPGYIKDPKFQIPLLFYKVIIFQSTKGIFSTAFMMSHEQKMIEQKMFVEKNAAKIMQLADVIAEPDFTDFKYKKVFQVNVKYLEDATGLNFSWKGVKPIEVPNDKNQIKKILKISDKDEADKAEKLLRKGIAPEMYTLEADLTSSEIKNNAYRLNIILP
jgi:DNA/RNA endonuclease G (NUC1)